MTLAKTWNFGDRVVHTGKPEWGAGVVTAAVKTTHEGKPCQSLTIRFERAGVKTISTAFANLIDAASAPSLASLAMAIEPKPDATGPSNRTSPFAADDPLMSKLSGGGEIRERMVKLPEIATDPFKTPVQRLIGTLGLYRFTPTGGSLLDWAAMQSGLADPLSLFNRHELEQFFQTFAQSRDAHLKRILQEARKADPTGTSKAIAAAPANVQQLMRRLDNGR